MAYLEILQKHNADLGGLIEKANTLPEKGDLGKQVDALIDGTITEVDSGATRIRNIAFRYCPNLAFANLPNATSIDSSAFYQCAELTSVNIPKATSIGNSVFYQCAKLQSADFPNATSIGSSAFRNCDELAIAHLPKVASVGAIAFQKCKKLVTVDLGATNIATEAFESCTALKAVALRAETVCVLEHPNAFNNCTHFNGTTGVSQDGYFYVPANLVDAYKRATNWSTYASRFRALEDYTVDGTITGALDPNKI